jgi:diguanylate cyclase
VNAILAMSRSLDTDVIAEGIATGQQLTIMRQMRCPEIEGFSWASRFPARQSVNTLMISRSRFYAS